MTCHSFFFLTKLYIFHSLARCISTFTLVNMVKVIKIQTLLYKIRSDIRTCTVLNNSTQNIIFSKCLLRYGVLRVFLCDVLCVGFSHGALKFDIIYIAYNILTLNISSIYINIPTVVINSIFKQGHNEQGPATVAFVCCCCFLQKKK